MSDDPHTSHACGHDAHTAMLLGAMRVLAEQRDNLAGVIYFCFEEGEEDGRGILAMLNQLSAHGVDVCWGIHVYAGLESGKICVSAGPRMAGAAGVGIKVIGRGGHGSRPDMSVNPVFCAASILTNTATAWVNQITAGRTVTLGVTSIQGGEAPNVIPDTADILGSLRFFNDEEGEKAVRIFKNVAEHTAAMNNCQVQFDDRFCVLCAPVINDEYYSNLISAALPEVLLENVTVSSCEPMVCIGVILLLSKNLSECTGHTLELIIRPTVRVQHIIMVSLMWIEGVLSTGVIATLKFVAMLQK